MPDDKERKRYSLKASTCALTYACAVDLSPPSELLGPSSSNLSYVRGAEDSAFQFLALFSDCRIRELDSSATDCPALWPSSGVSSASTFAPVCKQTLGFSAEWPGAQEPRALRQKPSVSKHWESSEERKRNLYGSPPVKQARCCLTSTETEPGEPRAWGNPAGSRRGRRDPWCRAEAGTAAAANGRETDSGF